MDLNHQHFPKLLGGFVEAKQWSIQESLALMAALQCYHSNLIATFPLGRLIHFITMLDFTLLKPRSGVGAPAATLAQGELFLIPAFPGSWAGDISKSATIPPQFSICKENFIPNLKPPSLPLGSVIAGALPKEGGGAGTALVPTPPWGLL